MIATAMLACDAAMDVGETAITTRSDYEARGVSRDVLAHVAQAAESKVLCTLQSIETRDNHKQSRWNSRWASRQRLPRRSDAGARPATLRTPKCSPVRGRLCIPELTACIDKCFSGRARQLCWRVLTGFSILQRSAFPNTAPEMGLRATGPMQANASVNSSAGFPVSY